MKRFLLLLVAISLCGSVVARADETIRAAQSRLKEGGFYFGEVNGTSSSETAAAVTRYQIRHGLPITGQLDAETMKSLRVAAPKTAAAPVASESETWRQMRKTDERFLRQMNRRSPAPRRAAVEPAGGPGTIRLSQERLRDYVGAFVLAGLDQRVGSELEFFADRVKYYDRGTIPREQIRRDLVRYSQRWPQRRFWLAGEVEVEPQSNSLLRVTFPLRYELRSAAERSRGKILKTIVVEVTGDDLQIVAVNERKAR